VKRGGATPFPGEEGTSEWCMRVLTAAPAAAPLVSRGGRRLGGERVEAAGPAGGQGPVGWEAGGWAWGAGGEVRGQRRPAAVGFELIGFDIDSGRGVDGAPS
jgi:hypothetical protein